MVVSPAVIRKTITLSSKDTAWTDLAGFGMKVGDRIGDAPRTHDEREDFCARHFLLALAASGELPYPTRISMLKQDQGGTWPDCLVWWNEGSDPIGLEITQATSREWQEELTRDERELALSDSNSADQVVFVPASEDGWAGNAPERDVAALIADAVSAKAEGLNRPVPKYCGTEECDLLVYTDDAPALVAGINAHDGTQPLQTLIGIFESNQRPKIDTYVRMFKRVSVLIGDKLIYSQLSEPRVIYVPTTKIGGLQ
jgi:hypothetical protein